MCIYFNPKLEDLSEKELEGADQAAVDNGDEEEEEFSDEDNPPAPEEEIRGLSSLNKVMNMLGEDEVLEETWTQLSDIKKKEVFDIIFDLDLETEMEDMSEKGKEAMAHVRAIFEGKSDGSFEFGNVRVFDQAAVDHEEMKYIRGFQCIMSIVGVDEFMLEETWSQLCVIKKKEVFDIILNLDNVEFEIEDISEEVKESVAIAAACVRAIIEGMSAGITSEEPF
eukprot:GFUD01135477.1.p1 GENE.GFUD01135477.1~~GFUD01135477.1.p1  ORF type:complete len:224 (+),score=78.67 GFUD01135477.1:55-726(+)